MVRKYSEKGWGGGGEMGGITPRSIILLASARGTQTFFNLILEIGKGFFRVRKRKNGWKV
jgi:hypothetical protein